MPRRNGLIAANEINSATLFSLRCTLSNLRHLITLLTCNTRTLRKSRCYRVRVQFICISDESLRASSSNYPELELRDFSRMSYLIFVHHFRSENLSIYFELFLLYDRSSLTTTPTRGGGGVLIVLVVEELMEVVLSV